MTPRWRVLHAYPEARSRAVYVAIAVLAAVAVFYQTYVQGAVSPLIIRDFSMPFTLFVSVSIIGNAVGAVASYASGIADRIGRVNLVILGLAAAAFLTGVLIPSADSVPVYIGFYALLSLVAGVVLVATPSLVRDFSPQLGRAFAIALWTLGPVLGNLLLSAATNRLLPAHPDWQFHFRLAAAFGVVVLAIAWFGLRELSPGLRNQLIVAEQERVLLEARAESTPDYDAAVSVWRPALVLPAIGIGLFLMFYVTRVGFLVLYYVTTFGYSPAKANGLATWFWAANAITLVLVGLLSDRLRVRKPFILAGGLLSSAALAVFATKATQPETSYETFALLLVVLAAGGAMLNCGFLTAFSETVEHISPGAVARGMAVYASTLRVMVTVTLAGFLTVVTSPALLVDNGAKVQELSTRYAAELKSSPESIPAEDLKFLSENGPRVKAAVVAGPRQWQTWWWICLAGHLVAIPLLVRVRGRWSVRAARRDVADREQAVTSELAAFRA